MATADASRNTQADAQRMRDDWLARLTQLIESADAWGRELGWSTRRIDKRIKDSVVGTYEAPGLLLQKEFRRVAVEPIARTAPGVEGVVDMYLLPAYEDIASLIFQNGLWRLQFLDRCGVDAETAPSAVLTKEVFAQALEVMVANGAKA